MRAMWKGAVSFGLVTIPVRLYSATENRDIQFHQVRASDGSRIKYKRVAEADGQEVAYADIAKGYAAPDGHTVILTDEDLATLPSRSSKEISVDKFVPAAQIDPLLLDRSYYLEPDKVAVKPYALLREALRSSQRMALVTIAVRSRMTLAVLRVRDDVIVLQTLLWPDEIRQADFDVLDGVPEPSEAEVKMADLLIDSMAGDFDPGDYEDDYRSAVETLVEQKIAGGAATLPPAAREDSGDKVVDLLAALQQSVDRAKAARQSGGRGDDEAAGTPGGQDSEHDEGAAVGHSDPAGQETTDGADEPATTQAAPKTTRKKAG